ncbi:MAG: 2-hydroxyacyl-CoA dehydratase family protein [Thermodesulfobacteriota bacterium]|nr:2-hydroxyacyl-CoA dehydratase family protein [Thermodesulfobacteriota bacterium]
MSSVSVEPFVSALNESENRFREVAGKGKKIIGYFCTYTPVELIHAAGFIPVRVMGGIGEVNDAYSLAPNFICPPLLLSLEKALKGKYDYLSGIVQGYTCDVVCGLVNIWEENIGGEIYHTIPLPYNDNPEARGYFRSCIEELNDKLKNIGGKITEDSLNDSLNLYAGIREIVLGLYNKLRESLLPLSAVDLFHVIRAGFVMPPEDYFDMLKILQKEIEDAEIPERGGIPILISGSLVEDPRAFKILEEVGGKIVSDDLCTGFRHFYPPDGEGGDAVERLIDRYMKRFPCPARIRARERAPLLIDLVKRSGAKGILFLFEKFCTPHLADYPILREELIKENIPSIVVETEETGIMEGQLRTRLQGFIEMLEG